MGDITRLPGLGCQYYIDGRCLYEEMLNPGYTQRWRCQVLLKWGSAFDDFLERAESFGIEQDAVPELWERQFERMAREAFHCEQYSYFHGSDIPSCHHHALDGLCRLALPDCGGRCRQYKVETCLVEDEYEDE